MSDDELIEVTKLRFDLEVEQRAKRHMAVCPEADLREQLEQAAQELADTKDATSIAIGSLKAQLERAEQELDQPCDLCLVQAHGPRRKREICGHHYRGAIEAMEAAEGEAKRLREALRRLVAGVRATVGMDRAAIMGLVGLTSFAGLENRIDEAKALLFQHAEPEAVRHTGQWDCPYDCDHYQPEKVQATNGEPADE